jgi:hypothetical protein
LSQVCCLNIQAKMRSLKQTAWNLRKEHRLNTGAVRIWRLAAPT